MAFYGLTLKYALDGSSNYIGWKDRMEVVLEDNGLKDFIDQEVPKPTGATQLEEWKKCVARAKRIILEGVRDHIILSRHGKETLHAIWKTLKGLYQNRNGQRKLTLKNKLYKIRCEKGDTCRAVTRVSFTSSYATLISQSGNALLLQRVSQSEAIRQSNA